MNFSQDSLLHGIFGQIPFRQIRDSLHATEKKEYGRIQQKENQLHYPKRLIRLYLMASGIHEPAQQQKYLKQFDKLLAKVRQRIQQEDAKKSLNPYNKAELVLHVLHQELFEISLTGRGAGYNVGIKTTLDKGEYNCYKSALIYNAILAELGFQTRYTAVPEHIYSVVQIPVNSGKPLEIPVETTNAYGFDPWDKGAPKYHRRFDKPNIKFDKQRYRRHSKMYNIGVLASVLSNRALIFAGNVRHPAFQAAKDLERANALLILATLLSQSQDKDIQTNLMSASGEFAQKLMTDKPLEATEITQRYKRFLKSDFITINTQNAHRNIDISFSKAMAQQFKQITKQKNNSQWQKTQSLIKTFNEAQEIIKNPDGKHNLTLYFVNTVEKILNSQLKKRPSNTNFAQTNQKYGKIMEHVGQALKQTSAPEKISHGFWQNALVGWYKWIQNSNIFDNLENARKFSTAYYQFLQSNSLAEKGKRGGKLAQIHQSACNLPLIQLNNLSINRFNGGQKDEAIKISQFALDLAQKNTCLKNSRVLQNLKNNYKAFKQRQ